MAYEAAPGADGDHEIGGGRRTHVCDAVLVVGVDEADGAWSEAVTRSVDGELDGAFANQPHLGMHVMMRRVGCAARRQRGFVGFKRFAGGELAFQNGANLGAVGWIHR